MKKINLAPEVNRSLFNFCFVLLLSNLFLISGKCYSQTNQPDLMRYKNVIKNADTQVKVNIKTNDQFHASVTTLSQFQLNPGSEIAVMGNGNKTEAAVSDKIFTEGGETKSIKGMVLPELYIGRIEEETRPIIFRIFIDTIQPLVYDETAGKYKGSIDITLLDDTQENLDKKQLSEPVMVSISTDPRTIADPKDINIDHINLPTTVVNITDSSPINPVTLIVKTDFKPQGYVTHISKGKRLSIDTPSKELQGFGIQALPIAVSIMGFRDDESVDVSFVSDRGSFSPSKIKVNGNQSAEVMYRSEWYGKSTITVKAYNLSDVSREFDVVFPWRFIIFSVLGGLIGALIKRSMGSGSKNFFKVLGQGLLTGFVVAVLWALGINVFNIDLKLSYNEFSVLIISVLGALLWEKIYEWLKGIVGTKTPTPRPTP